MKLPLKYQVLEAIAKSCDADGHPIRPTYEVISESFPDMPPVEKKSIVAKLHQEDLLGYPQETHDGKTYCAIDPAAYAVIIEEKDKIEQCNEEHRFHLKIACLSAAFGFLAGLLSGLLTPFAHRLLEMSVCNLMETP